MAHDWTNFRLALEDTYEGTSALYRHSEQNLLDFVRRSSKSRIRPDQPSSVYFDYPEVYRVATAAFSGNHPLDLVLDDPLDEPQSRKSSRLERAQERCADDPTKRSVTHEGRTRVIGPTNNHRCPPSPVNHAPCDSRYRCSDTHRSPLVSEAKIHVVRFKDSTQEEEDRELEDLIRRVAQCLPEPVLAQHTGMPTSTLTPATSLYLQAPTLPPSPVRQSWPAAANTPPIPHPPFAYSPASTSANALPRVYAFGTRLSFGQLALPQRSAYSK